MLNPHHLSLGAELAREQDLVLLHRRISELDLLRGMGRARLRVAERYRKFAVCLVGLFIVATTIVATVAFKFPIVHYTVQGEAAALPAQRVFGQWVVASAHEPKTVKFSDGSATRLAPGSRVRLIGTNRRGAIINLESGLAELWLAGSTLTEYLVSVGPFSLALAKGHVVVSWDPANELLDLVVHEGYVVISGCQFGAGRSVTAGRELSTRCLAR